MPDERSPVEISEPAPLAGAETAEGGSAEEAVAEDLRRTREERERLNDLLLRTAADFENYRKRVQRETQEQRVQAAADVLRAFLPVLDGFERALAAPAGAPEEFRRGVEMIHKQMQDAAKRVGLEAIEAVGKPFDPHWHEAIEMVETAEHPDHSVLQQLQCGYRFKDKLIRPAMVRVARNTK